MIRTSADSSSLTSILPTADREFTMNRGHRHYHPGQETTTKSEDVVMRRTLAARDILALLCTTFVSTAAGAQQSSAIAGAVRDSTGAVLPGVAVEASSPAL